jgi:DNA-binding transcriptional MerR regulator
MDNEDRTRNYGGNDQAGDSSEAPAGTRESDDLTIGELARESGVTLRALRLYESKGLLVRQCRGGAQVFTQDVRDRLALILQGKRLGFTLNEIREMLAARAQGCAKALPIDRRKCVDQINMLERQRRDIDRAIAEFRQIYTEMFIKSGNLPATRMSGTR